jgi:[acyl-carrier-protein] S-malonyltransferase
MTIAFVFPGQGSQSLGMMSGYGKLPAIRETFAEASEVLKQDLWLLAEQGPAEELNLTVNTQPLMLAAGVAVLRAWNAQGGASPAVMAGHSLGEYSALVAAGSIGFVDAIELVRFRAQCMQESVPAGTGAMAAVLGLEDEAVRAACKEASQGEEVAEPANFNSPGQVVVAGHRPAVERAIEIAKAKGAKRAMLLPMSVPSHCSLMEPAANRLRERLGGVSVAKPLIPVLQNCDVAAPESASEVKEALVRQLFCPVRWGDTVKALSARGVTHIVECGPGKVLAGLNKRISSELQSYALANGDSFREALSGLKG